MNEPVEWITEHDAEVIFTSEHSLDIRVVNASPMGIFVPDLIGTGMKPRSSKRCAVSLIGEMSWFTVQPPSKSAYSVATQTWTLKSLVDIL